MTLYSWRWVCYLLALVTVSSQCSDHTENRTNLTFMLIISYGQFGFNSSGGLPAAEMALEDINKNPDVLPGYNLVYDTVRNSECHRGISLDTFFQGILSDPVKLAVVGCGCSVATTPVAEISYQWNISQISYSSGSPALSDRNRFKKYFRNSPASDIIAPTLRSTAVHFNWTRVAMITQNEALFTIGETRFRNELERANITVTSRTFETNADPVLTEDLFVESEDYRVIMINSYSGTAKKIICEAFKRNYTYPRYAWITYHWYPRQWWTQNVNDVEVDCTDEDLERFLERALTLQRYQTLIDENATTDTGIVFRDFEREYERRATIGRFAMVDVRFRIYDALWALALALNSTMTMVEESDISRTDCDGMNGSLVPLDQFDYSNALMGCLIQWNLQRTNFSGISGHVRFDENGTLIQTRTTLYQYQFDGGSLVRRLIAYLERAVDFKFAFDSGVNETNIFPVGTPPDGSPDEIPHTFEPWLVAVFYILATFGIAFAIGCLLFNLLFRKKKLIKISSPNLNYFIIAGAILMYTSIYFYLMPVISEGAVQARCIIEHWLFTVGYSLAFGTVLAKMWRVYQIFNNPKLNKKGFKDWHMLIFIIIITGIAVLLLFLEDAIPHLRGSVTRERDQEHPIGKTPLNVTIEFYVMVCYEGSSPSFFWQIFIFVYLAILQIVGIVLAFQTRRVKLHGLRDSKYIAAIIYISSIILVVLALVTFSLRTFINIGTGIFAFGILIFTTIFLSLIFIPKMVMLYQDPEGESVGTTPSNVEKPRFTTNQSNTSDNDKVTLLERAVQEKETKINELTLEIRALKGTGYHNEVHAQNGEINTTNNTNL